MGYGGAAAVRMWNRTIRRSSIYFLVASTVPAQLHQFFALTDRTRTRSISEYSMLNWYNAYTMSMSPEFFEPPHFFSFFDLLGLDCCFGSGRY